MDTTCNNSCSSLWRASYGSVSWCILCVFQCQYKASNKKTLLNETIAFIFICTQKDLLALDKIKIKFVGTLFWKQKNYPGLPQFALSKLLSNIRCKSAFPMNLLWFSIQCQLFQIYFLFYNDVWTSNKLLLHSSIWYSSQIPRREIEKLWISYELFKKNSMV